MQIFLDMIEGVKTPIYNEDTHDLYGFLVKDITGWQAQTIFGYTIERTTSQEDAEKVLRERGLLYLKGTWNYLDPDDREWYPCVISDATERRVTVIRTNELGFQNQDDFKMVILNEPSEDTLVKIS